jgi:hypothetical protein
MLTAMRSQKQMALFGLGGGVALASAAFAIGSQAGGGSAVAGTSSAAPAVEAAATPASKPVHLRGPGGEKPLGDLATRLGVDEAKLRAALEDLRPERKEIDGHAAELAKILKLDEAKVKGALEKIRPARAQRHDRRRVPGFVVDELVKDLKLDEAEVRAAIEKVLPGEPPERGERPDKEAMLAALAKELGVEAAKVRESLSDVRGTRHEHHERHGPGHRGGPGGPASQELAEELGVSTATLEKAFETLHEQRRAQFAKDLAERLSISPEKVEEVLRDMPHGGRRGHR